VIAPHTNGKIGLGQRPPIATGAGSVTPPLFSDAEGFLLNNFSLSQLVIYSFWIAWT
jgi:hypothetical protein